MVWDPVNSGNPYEGIIAPQSFQLGTVTVRIQGRELGRLRLSSPSLFCCLSKTSHSSWGSGSNEP